MNDDARFLDEGTERLLRSSALWEDPGDVVGARINEAVAASEPGIETPIRAWILGGIAAAVVLIATLANLVDAPDWRIEIVAAEGMTAAGEIIGFNEATGTRLVLEIRDLPQAEPGTFYEMWWMREGGEAVSSGSFLGPDTVPMWMGIRRSEFPQVLITLEPSDGDPAPSGNIVARSADS